MAKKITADTNIYMTTNGLSNCILHLKWFAKEIDFGWYKVREIFYWWKSLIFELRPYWRLLGVKGMTDQLWGTLSERNSEFRRINNRSDR